MATLTAAADGRSATMAVTAGADTNDSATTRRDSVPGAVGGTVERAASRVRPGGETGAAGSGPGPDTSAAPAIGSGTPVASGAPVASGDRAEVRGGDGTVRAVEGARDPATLFSGTGGDRHAGSGSGVRGDDTDGAASVAGDGLHGRGVAPPGSAGVSGDAASMTDPATTGPVPGGSMTGGTDTAASAGAIAGPASSSGPAAGSTGAAATSGANGGTGVQAPSGAGDAAGRDDVTAAVSADAFGPSARPPGFIAGGTGAGAERQTASDTSGMNLPALARDAATAFDPASGPVGAGVWPDRASDASGLWHEFRSEWLHSGGGGSGALTDLPDRRNDAGLTPDTSVLPS